MMTDWMRDRVIRAAQLFARNADWPAIAAEVNSRPEVCKRWPIQYVDVFLTAFKVEKMRIYEENYLVWLVTLRSQLENKDEEVRRNAAVLWAEYGWDLELERRWERQHIVPENVRPSAVCEGRERRRSMVLTIGRRMRQLWSRCIGR